MFNEECRREIDYFFEKLNEYRMSGRVPSMSKIYHILETYSYDKREIGTSVADIQSELISTAFLSAKDNPKFTNKKIIQESIPATDKKLSYNYVEYFTALATDETYKVMDSDDLIWLHFSIRPESLKDVTEEVIRILNEKSISHRIRIPNVVGPDALVVCTYSKEGANELLNACENNQVIQDSITINNPFMPHRHGIGVIKETKNKSYTKHLSELLYEYARESQDKNLSFKGFYRYVSKIFKEGKLERTYQERYLDYQLTLALYSIYNDKDYLENVIHLPKITYRKAEFDKYHVTYENGDYCYTDRDGKVITHNNYFEWLKLQAYNCIQRMYYEQKGELLKEDDYLSDSFTGAMSTLIDNIMEGGAFYVPSNYHEPMVCDLFPCLVGYFAYEAKMTTEEEIKLIVEKVKRRMVKKLNVSGTNKNFYQVDDKSIQSTIPPIRVDNALIGIEYLDYELNYCNVFVYQDDKVQGHLGLFLDVEKDKIWEENDIATSTYRASVARSLLRFNTLEKETIKRGFHEGVLVHLDSDSYVDVKQTEESTKLKS